MNAMNHSPIGVWVAAILLSLLAAGPVQADCEWSDRIEKDSAECLSGGWENHTWPDKDTAWVKNECPGLGTLVAKVDREGAADWTKWLDNDSRVNMSGAYGNVRGIHCCSDLGFCNKEDVINVDGCYAQYNESPASDAAISSSASDPGPAPGEDLYAACYGLSFAADASAGTCTVTGTCRRVNDAGTTVVGPTSITAPYEDTDEIQVCDGHFCLEGS